MVLRNTADKLTDIKVALFAVIQNWFAFLFDIIRNFASFVNNKTKIFA